VDEWLRGYVVTWLSRDARLCVLVT